MWSQNKKAVSCLVPCAVKSVFTKHEAPSAGRFSLWVIPLLLLAGCGFEPLYGSKGNAPSAALAGVRVDTVSGRMGQQFKADLEDKLNPGGAIPASAPYRLSASLAHSVGAIGVARDGTVSRYNVYLDSNYTLYRISDDKPVTSGSIRHVSSYNNVERAYFSTYVSEADAVRRGVTELAEIFRQRLSAYMVAPPKVKNAVTPPTAAPLTTPGALLPDTLENWRR